MNPVEMGERKSFGFFTSTKMGSQPGRSGNSLLYRLPEVIKAKSVIIVEGEAKADLLHRWGLTATCLDAGAQSRTTDEMVSHLSRKRIVIIPDNDDPGKEFAHRIAASLYGRVENLKVVALPGLREKEDVIDWARQAGNDRGRLLEVLNEASDWKP